MPTTSPDNLWSPDNSDNFEDLVSDLATMQGSVQAALSSRAIRTYKWADTAARNAQTGMSEGDLGYQMDSDEFWVFTGSSWVPDVEPVQQWVDGAVSTIRGRTQTGVGRVIGNGTNAVLATVTFPVAFSSPPSVVAVFAGASTSASFNPASTSQAVGISAYPAGVSTSGFTMRLDRTTAFAATFYYYYSWHAIGAV